MATVVSDTQVIPPFVCHYLADADVRVRERTYRAEQQVAIREIIFAIEGECSGE